MSTIITLDTPIKFLREDGRATHSKKKSYPINLLGPSCCVPLRRGSGSAVHRGAFLGCRCLDGLPLPDVSDTRRSARSGPQDPIDQEAPRRLESHRDSDPH